MTNADIFKTAHTLAKTYTGNYGARFAMALREAHKIARLGKKFPAIIEGSSNSAKLKFSLWFSTDGAKARYYLTLVFSDHTTIKVGYINAYTNETSFADRGGDALWANRVANAIFGLN
jgi:hypothetical protein